MQQQQQQQQQQGPSIHSLGGYTRAQQQHQEHRRNRHEFLSLCEEADEECVVCRVRGVQQCGSHALDKAAHDDYCLRCLCVHVNFFGHCMKYQPGVCWTCGIPINHALSHGRETNACNPAIQRTVYPYCWAAFHTVDFRPGLLQMCQAIDDSVPPLGSKQEYAQWLSHRNRNGESNAMSISLNFFLS